jgi:predicted  nucleic acid-binding Zn-ribbon protein
MKRCSKCGSQWPDKANFCPKDGASLKAEVPSDEEAAPATVKGAPPEKETTDDYDDAGAASETGRPRRPRGFSETQWFMAAQDPDKLKDEATAEDLATMQGDYDWDSNISEEDRAKFSLRTGNKKKKKE